ncbi:ABC transporter permease [Clostridium pasteurianum]|uniref:ABC-type transport system, involved in lipoprotein release, permease component n=1 Tax=Clostridium pasteurianum BC1 TaxID=86416 RepID=R4K2D7_CLOPA|nr:ABC transporter permease [Clostridium pasteurianum]AGK95906.1 ABC-type transport system, involved in lipoprotein release, permease component [Clostridium pasteurianum BC1]
MLTSLKIAIRFLRSSKIQTFIIIFGIAIGISVQIFVGLLSQGLEKSLLSKVIGSMVHISVTSNKDGIESWQTIENEIKKISNEITTVAPGVQYNALIELGRKKENIQVRGFFPKDADELYNMKDKVYEGKMIDKDGEALIGKDLKDKLRINIGDKINIVNFDGKKTQLTVVGFYDLGAVKINSAWIITNLKTAQDLSELGDEITFMEISVKDPYNADVIQNKMQSFFKDKDLNIKNWKEENELIASAIIGQRICSIIIQFFVLLAAALSIISILNISVVQKYKQIGILKAMGIKDDSAALVFILQAFILGVIGTAVGIFFTLLYIKGFNKYIITSDGKPIVDIIISIRFIGVSSLIAVASSTLAAILPALKSFKLNPVEVIKNG